MKSLSQRAIASAAITFFILFFVTSCSKSSSGASGSAGAAMTATVDSAEWANSYPVIGVYSAGGNNFDINGVQHKGDDTTVFDVIFFTPISVNQVVNSDTSQIVVAYLDGKTATAYSSLYFYGHSLLKITSYDTAAHKIVGEFSGILHNIHNGNDSLVVTNGKFNTSFQVQ